MRFSRLFRASLPVLLGVAAGHAASLDGRWGPELASLRGATPVLAGEALVNLLPVRYRLYAGGIPAGTIAALRGRIDRERPKASSLVAHTPAGPVRVTALQKGGSSLLLALLEGRIPLIAVAVLDSELALDSKEETGDAPGRDPAGWPRTGSLRRVLHIAGEGYESAVYRGKGGAHGIIESAAAGLDRSGWRVMGRNPDSLAALAPGGRELAFFASASGGETDLLVLAAGNSR